SSVDLALAAEVLEFDQPAHVLQGDPHGAVGERRLRVRGVADLLADDEGPPAHGAELGLLQRGGDAHLRLDEQRLALERDRRRRRGGGGGAAGGGKGPPPPRRDRTGPGHRARQGLTATWGPPFQGMEGIRAASTTAYGLGHIMGGRGFTKEGRPRPPRPRPAA